MAKRGNRAGAANDAATAGKSRLSDDEPTVWRLPAAPAPARTRPDDETDAMEAELEAAMEYILALEGDAGIDRIVTVVTRTVARRGGRRPSSRYRP